MTTARRAACVIGYPAKHSRSPKLHGYWLRRYGIDGDYRAEEIAPEDFARFVSNLAANGYVGANVTIPHKEAALALARPDTRAQAVGAANTLWFEDGRLRATNTDVEGFIAALDSCAPGWDRRGGDAVVLGAGGAGRAIVHGLLERGIATVHVVNRTPERAAAFRERFGARVRPAGWAELPALLAGATLLANSTSLGMKGQPELAVDLSPMPDGAVVADAVYIPLRTALLRAAEDRGFATSNGLDMLLHQAVRGFELWFGVRPEVTTELRDLLVADIEKA